jgi:hypothetical protein
MVDSAICLGHGNNNGERVLSARLFATVIKESGDLLFLFVGGFFQNARIIGYDGVIEIERPFTIFPDRVSTIRLWRGAHFAQLDEIAVAPCNHFVEQAVAFAHAVAVPAAERSPTSLLDSYANAQVIDAWRRSLTSGLREYIGRE